MGMTNAPTNTQNPDNIDGSTTSKFVEPTQSQNPGQEPLKWTNEKIIENLNNLIVREKNQRERGKEIDPTIPWDRATMSWEYRTCKSLTCKCKLGGDFRHGPYLVMVWKDLDSNQYRNKVKKKYLGKSGYKSMDVNEVLDKLSHKKKCKEVGIIDRDYTMTKLNKCQAIVEAADNGNKLAEEYIQKLDSRKVTIDWAYKKVFKLNQTENHEKVINI